MRTLATSCNAFAAAMQVRFFGSPRDTGLGDLKRLEAAIKAGSIDQVYMQTRWNGHTTTQTVTRLCKERGIQCFLLDAAGKARRKSEWAEATTSSDGELGLESV